MSQTQQCVKHFVESGGRVSRDGKFVFGIKGYELKQQLNGRENRKYHAVKVHMPRPCGGVSVAVAVHRIVAYLKFGDAALTTSTVRHLDDNPLNNHWDNIALGSVRDNAMDRDPKERAMHAQRAGKAASRYDDALWEQVRADYASGLGYKKLRKKYDIPLGTLSYQLSPKSRHAAFNLKISQTPNGE